MYDRGPRRSFAPVRVGDELNLKIEAVGAKGDGIAKVKGFVIFVPSAQQGQEYKVRITKVLNKVGFGEILGAADASASSSQTEGSSAEGSESSEPKEEYSEEANTTEGEQEEF